MKINRTIKNNKGLIELIKNNKGLIELIKIIKV